MENIKCYDSNGSVLEYMYQWDSNQTIVLKNLDLPAAPNCHFSNRNRKTAFIVPSALSGADIVVSVPNVLLQEAVPILVYVNCNLSDGSSKTLYRVVIPVIPRPRPSEYDDSNTEITGTSDATAVSTDIVDGKTAYAKGVKLIGSMKKATPVLATVGEEYGYITLKRTDTDKRYIDPSTGMTLLANPSDFGNATAEDVVQGKTFTSESGLKVEGSAVMSGGVDTSDATATAADMAEGATAYVNGEKITGTVKVVGEGDSMSVGATMYSEVVEFESAPGIIYANCNHNPAGAAGRDRLLRTGALVAIPISSDKFGDAQASDVAAGKTFTSAAGLKVVGTGTSGGGFSVTDDGNGNVVITSASVTDNNGDVVIS